MADHDEYERNKSSYQRLKDTITKTYPHGWFVAIGDDRLLGAAADFRAMVTSLRVQGIDPRRVLVVEAGVDYPEHLTIFV